MVFTESQFNVGPNAFALSSKGDAIYLFSANGTNITGYVHGFDFGPQASGVTFGRYLISTGGDQFVTQISSTLGAANSGPSVGPIVISEIMYHPPDTLVDTITYNNSDDEFIELSNTSDSPAPLFDPNFPTNTWHLRNAVDFDFPPNVVLPPHGVLLVVSFDPTNTAALND